MAGYVYSCRETGNCFLIYLYMPFIIFFCKADRAVQAHRHDAQ